MKVLKVMAICLTSTKPLTGEDLVKLIFEEKNKFTQRVKIDMNKENN